MTSTNPRPGTGGRFPCETCGHEFSAELILATFPQCQIVCSCGTLAYHPKTKPLPNFDAVSLLAKVTDDVH